MQWYVRMIELKCGKNFAHLSLGNLDKITLPSNNLFWMKQTEIWVMMMVDGIEAISATSLLIIMIACGWVCELHGVNIILIIMHWLVCAVLTSNMVTTVSIRAHQYNKWHEEKDNVIKIGVANMIMMRPVHTPPSQRVRNWLKGNMIYSSLHIECWISLL